MAGFNLSAESLNELVSQQHANLIRLNEEHNFKRHKNTHLPDDFIMFTGGNVDLIEKILCGCNGLSSMIGNIFPKEIKQILNDLLMKKSVNVHKINQLIDEVTHDQAVINIKEHYISLGIK